MKNDSVPVEKHLLVEPWASDPSKLTLDATTYGNFRAARFDALLKIAQRVVNPENP